jgi:hypothetical protein
MRINARYPMRVLAPLAIAAAMSAPVNAQQMSERASCHFSGANALEQLGANHFLQVSHYTCNVESGPFKGNVMTGTTVWEHRGEGSAQVRAGYGVSRGPAGTAVFETSEGELKVAITDGRPTGFTSSGKSTFRMAAGGAAGQANKPITWKAQGTGPLTFSLEWRTD